MRRLSCIGNFALGVLAASASPAGTFTVTSVNDSGAGTLRAPSPGSRWPCSC